MQVDYKAPKDAYTEKGLPGHQRGLDKASSFLKLAESFVDSDIGKGVMNLGGRALGSLGESMDDLALIGEAKKQEELQKAAAEAAALRAGAARDAELGRQADWRKATEQGGAGDMFMEPTPTGPGAWAQADKYVDDRPGVEMPGVRVEKQPLVGAGGYEAYTPTSITPQGPVARGANLQLAALVRQLNEVDALVEQGMGNEQLDERRKFILAEMDRLQPRADGSAFSQPGAAPLVSARDVVSSVPSNVLPPEQSAPPYTPTPAPVRADVSSLSAAEQRKYKQVLAALEDPASLSPEHLSKLNQYKGMIEQKLAAKAPTPAPTAPGESTEIAKLRADYVAAINRGDEAAQRDIENKARALARPAGAAPQAETLDSLRQQAMDAKAAYDKALAAGNFSAAQQHRVRLNDLLAKARSIASNTPAAPAFATEEEPVGTDAASIVAKVEKDMQAAMRAGNYTRAMELDAVRNHYLQQVKAPAAPAANTTPRAERQADGTWKVIRPTKPRLEDLYAEAAGAADTASRQAVLRKLAEVDIPMSSIGNRVSGADYRTQVKQLEELFPRLPAKDQNEIWASIYSKLAGGSLKTATEERKGTEGATKAAQGAEKVAQGAERLAISGMTAAEQARHNAEQERLAASGAFKPSTFNTYVPPSAGPVPLAGAKEKNEIAQLDLEFKPYIDRHKAAVKLVAKLEKEVPKGDPPNVAALGASKQREEIEKWQKLNRTSLTPAQARAMKQELSKARQEERDALDALNTSGYVDKQREILARTGAKLGEAEKGGYNPLETSRRTSKKNK